jgi:hypothetical protein
MTRLEIGEEVAKKRAFAWAVEWPGWCRAGKDASLARDALIAVAPRYAIVAQRAGLTVPDTAAEAREALEVLVTVEGDGGTEFGVPSIITDLDRRPVRTAEAERLAGLVAAAWETFDVVAADAPLELRTGPRGGGRNRDRVITHVIEADHAYAREIGIRGPSTDPSDRAAVEAERAAMLAVLAQPSDGSPPAELRWANRYAARRIAWHALDHAWETEDRSTPG